MVRSLDDSWGVAPTGSDRTLDDIAVTDLSKADVEPGTSGGRVGGASGDGASSDDTADRILGTLGYQPAFDGIRFVGVTAFIVGHAGLLTNQPQLRPLVWWMAVDVFFVISGYLITTLLLREWASNGRISLKAFYVRRISRLYPLIAVVVVISMFQRLMRPDAVATPSWSAIVSMTFYYANFQQLAHPADLYNAWGSLWSLGIEEQFYLIWPLALIALLGRSFRLVPALIVAIAGAVAISSWRTYSWLTTPDLGSPLATYGHAWRNFYFSTFHRPDGLFIGCATAIVLALPRGSALRFALRVNHRLRVFTLAGAIFIITYASIDGHSGWQVCWGLSLFNLLVAATVVELIEFPGSYLAKVLSLRPLLWVGRRSYGMYILHLAFLMVLVDVLDVTSLPGILAATVVIIIAAGISYRYYEDPIRRWGYRVSKRITRRDTAR